MIRDIIQYAGETTWVQIGLIICLLLFIGIVVFTYMGRKSRYEHERHLPLEDGSGMNSNATESNSNSTSSQRTYS